MLTEEKTVAGGFAGSGLSAGGFAESWLNAGGFAESRLNAGGFAEGSREMTGRSAVYII